MRTIIVLCIVMLAACANADYYFEDFSSEPQGWQSGYERGSYSNPDSGFYVWDRFWQALYIDQPNKNYDGDDHYYCHPIDYDGGSFQFSFDLYVEDVRYNAKLTVGLSTAPNDAWSTLGLDPSWWRARYGQMQYEECGVDMMTAESFHYENVRNYHTEGQWWSHVLDYDALAGTIHSRVYRRDDPGIVLWDITRQGHFRDDMDWIVLSDNRNHEYPAGIGHISWGYLDNIAFIPEPAAVALLAAGVLVWRRR